MNVGDRVRRINGGPDSEQGTVLAWNEQTLQARIQWDDHDQPSVYGRENLVLVLAQGALPESRDRAAIDRWLDA